MNKPFLSNKTFFNMEEQLTIIINELTVILVPILGFCVMFHFLAHYFKPYSRLKMLTDDVERRVLFVTSHPDDETMFFGPAILTLCKHHHPRGKNVFLLCMSKGDHKKEGSKRKAV